MLEEERRFYAEHLDEWLSRLPGKFVLVKDSELVGAFDTVDEALAEGARRFGLTSFLVRRVEPEQAEVNIPALTLGVLHAGPNDPIRGPSTDA
jgi:hypothetical protein